MSLKLKMTLLLFPVFLAYSTPLPQDFFDFQLRSITNESFSFAHLKKNKASVIVFLLPDCPACESYSRTLNELREKYKNAGFEFYGIFPGKLNTPEEMISYQKRYKITFPLLQDPDNLLVKSMHAGIVPSVFLIDNKENILYKGRIDDWMYALGKRKAVLLLDNIHYGPTPVDTTDQTQFNIFYRISCSVIQIQSLRDYF